PTSVSVLGISPEEFIGNNALDYIEDKHKGRIQEVLANLPEEKRFKLEPFLFKDGKGEWRWIETIMTNLLDNPAIEGFLANSRDVTTQIEREQSLRELYQKNRLVLESTDEGLYGIDTEGRCTFINRAAANMLSYRSEECIGKNMHKLIHHKYSNGEFYPESECPIFISKNKHESCRVTDEVFWRSDGTCFNVEYTSSPMIQDGKIEGGVVAFSDITKRKQQEKELRESLEEKETLLLEVHHRVKNNLAIISSLITLQMLEVEDENFRNKLENTTSRIHSIAMVHELLYQSESFSEIPFEKYIKDLLLTIKRTIGPERNNIDLVTKVRVGGLNINQAVPLGLLLNELMTNSLKYAFINREKGKIMVSITRLGNNIKVLYEDNGEGYPDHIDFTDTDSLGNTLIHTLLKQLSGDFKIETKGKFRLEFQFEERIRGAHSNYSG
ncbi:MAG TPA: PAS domain S-box protein, partial [Gracilimonas sp.]|uniref:PAS domain-containing sensor histidine kinase n=1 Tax=Gracilimonas sp. TaxID=1974203 RepID=UPI002D8182FA|nr:PAS domain S-box protein [Gracilimonas sp.]